MADKPATESSATQGRGELATSETGKEEENWQPVKREKHSKRGEPSTARGGEPSTARGENSSPTVKRVGGGRTLRQQ